MRKSLSARLLSKGTRRSSRKAQTAYWQRWEDWSTLANNADFFIVMALDQDSINDPPVPASVVNYWWVKQVYAYLQSIASLATSHPIAWELPTYYRLYTQQQNGTWAVSSGTDVATRMTTALQSPTILQNYAQDPNDPYIEYLNTQDQTTYLFFETALSSDVLARTLTSLNGSRCLRLSFWDNDSGTSNTLGWSTILSDPSVHLC
jgi:spore germination protein YaaH